MNDPNESDFFLNSIGNAFLKYQEKYSLADKSAYFATTFSIWDQLKGDKYVLSLSEDSDSLTMWRAYGNDGRGVAIGINTEKLFQFITSHSDLYFLKVKYMDTLSHMQSFAEDDLEKIYNDIEIRDDGSVSSGWDIFSELYETSYLSYKNKAYNAENEWRVVLIKGGGCKYRESNGLIIPYCELEIPIELVEDIMIGPTANKELSKCTLENMIFNKINSHKKFTKKISVINSNIPYRKR